MPCQHGSKRYMTEYTGKREKCDTCDSYFDQCRQKFRTHLLFCCWNKLQWRLLFEACLVCKQSGMLYMTSNAFVQSCDLSRLKQLTLGRILFAHSLVS